MQHFEDMVRRTLQTNGYADKFEALSRTDITNAMSETGELRPANRYLRNFSQKPDAQALFFLIAEYLEGLNLKTSLLVFLAETGTKADDDLPANADAANLYRFVRALPTRDRTDRRIDRLVYFYDTEARSDRIPNFIGALKKRLNIPEYNECVRGAAMDPAVLNRSMRDSMMIGRRARANERRRRANSLQARQRPDMTDESLHLSFANVSNSSQYSVEFPSRDQAEPLNSRDFPTFDVPPGPAINNGTFVAERANRTYDQVPNGTFKVVQNATFNAGNGAGGSNPNRSQSGSRTCAGGARPKQRACSLDRFRTLPGRMLDIMALLEHENDSERLLLNNRDARELKEALKIDQDMELKIKALGPNIVVKQLEPRPLEETADNFSFDEDPFMYDDIAADPNAALVENIYINEGLRVPVKAQPPSYALQEDERQVYDNAMDQMLNPEMHLNQEEYRIVKEFENVNFNQTPPREDLREWRAPGDMMHPHAFAKRFGEMPPGYTKAYNLAQLRMPQHDAHKYAEPSPLSNDYSVPRASPPGTPPGSPRRRPAPLSNSFSVPRASPSGTPPGSPRRRPSPPARTSLSGSQQGSVPVAAACFGGPGQDQPIDLSTRTDGDIVNANFNATPDVITPVIQSSVGRALNAHFEAVPGPSGTSSRSSGKSCGRVDAEILATYSVPAEGTPGETVQSVLSGNVESAPVKIKLILTAPDGEIREVNVPVDSDFRPKSKIPKMSRRLRTSRSPLLHVPNLSSKIPILPGSNLGNPGKRRITIRIPIEIEESEPTGGRVFRPKSILKKKSAYVGRIKKGWTAKALLPRLKFSKFE